ncbi:hypothetical protein GGI20_005543, partial [Coemansia sp. BCRC 34301]
KSSSPSTTPSFRCAMPSQAATGRTLWSATTRLCKSRAIHHLLPGKRRACISIRWPEPSTTPNPASTSF